MARSVRVAHGPLREGPVTLGASEAHYLGRVHRLRVGDGFVVFDPERAEEADATVRAFSKAGVTCELAPPRAAARVPLAKVTLLQALGKADKPDRVIREATTLGASAIVLVHTERVVARSTEREAARVGRYRRIATDAARQSGRGDLPTLTGPVALETALDALGPHRLRCVLLPDAPEPLSAALAAEPLESSVALLVGPEGGFTDRELEMASGRGFAPVRLGRFVLRTETAAAAALAVVAARW